MSESAPIIPQVERLHAVLSVAMAIGAWLVADQQRLAGMVAGAFVGAANFHALAFVTRRMLDADRTRRHAAIALLVIKFLVLAGALGAIVTWLRPDTLTFLIGISLAPVSLVAVILTNSSATRRKEVT